MSDLIDNQDGLTRRELVFSAGAGVVGLAIGGGVVGALTTGDGNDGGSDGDSATDSTEPIIIGGAYPLTGVSAGDGVESKKALELAATALNEAGGLLGRKIETVSLDIESDFSPDKIRNVLQRLVSDERVSFVSMIFCDYTNGSWDPVVTKGVPLMHINTSVINTSWVEEDIAKRGMIFESCPNETWLGPNIVGLLGRLQEDGKWTPTKKSAAIVTSTDPYSVLIANSVRDGLKEKSWQIPVFEKVVAPLSEWGPVLAKIREAAPGLVVNTDWLATDLAAFTKQFMGSPTPSLVYEQFGPSTPEYIELAGESANGVLWSTTIGVLPDKMGQDFRARFEQESGTKMGFSSGAAVYDQTMTWAQAAALAGDANDFPSVVEQLNATIRRGMTGTLHFDPEDNQAISYPPAVNDPSLGMPLLTYQIQSGNQVCIDPYPYQSDFLLPEQLK